MIDPDEDAKKAEMRRMVEEEMGKNQKPVATGMKKGGKVSSASKRADGCAIRGKTRA
jgi:hypothetical protein